MSQYLPPGCTDSMCEPYDPSCVKCGCQSSSHYEEDQDMEIHESEPLNANQDFEYMAIELDSNGQIVHACDSLIGKCQCECEGFEE